MAEHATMDTVTEELCFLCGPGLDVSRTISECGAVDYNEVKPVGE
jgi:hypothetical protein